jgi:hypothetical protein
MRVKKKFQGDERAFWLFRRAHPKNHRMTKVIIFIYDKSSVLHNFVAHVEYEAHIYFAIKSFSRGRVFWSFGRARQ